MVARWWSLGFHNFLTAVNERYCFPEYHLIFLIDTQGHIAPCTCMNTTSCNQPKIVLEQESPASRGKECQRGVGTLKLLAV